MSENQEVQPEDKKKREPVWLTPPGPPETSKILEAARCIDAEKIKILLQNGCDPNEVNSCGDTALHILLSADKRTRMRRQSQYYARCAQCLYELLSRGANAGIVNLNGSIPEQGIYDQYFYTNAENMEALNFHQVLKTARLAQEQKQAIDYDRLFERKKISLDPRRHEWFKAIYAFDEKKLSELLDAGFPVDFIDIDHISGLHVAARSGDYECLRFLLTHGADPNIQSFWKRTALHIALFVDSHYDIDRKPNREKSIIELLSHNADASLVDQFGKRPEDMATDKFICIDGDTVNLYHLLRANRIEHDQQELRNHLDGPGLLPARKTRSRL